MNDIETIQAKIESAGKTIMMLPPQGTRPRGYASGWPEYIREFADMIEAPKQNKTPSPRATMQQMNELEVVEGWLVNLSQACIEKRIPWVAKTVAVGCLHWPISERRVFSWAKLARRMKCSDTSVKRWYADGVSMIASQLTEDDVTANLNGSVVRFDVKEKR